jgi:O-acetyl-ADP-ribose deacetylase (regulator of RNase III)
MSEIHYVLGDATRPQVPGPKIIAHICNDYGGWGRGFVVALSKRNRSPEELYRIIAASRPLVLGEVMLSDFGPDDPDVLVANMVAQHGNSTPQNPVAVDYKALRACLDQLGHDAADMNASVHMPRIGCGLGGGKWSVVEEAILAILVDVYGLQVYVYDLPTPLAVVAHHEMDEADSEFQHALHCLADRCACDVTPVTLVDAPEEARS